MDSVYKYAFIFWGTLVAIEAIVFMIVKDKKKRYILLCVIGIIGMASIFGSAIYLKETKIAIFMGILLFLYLVSLSYMWFKRVKKNERE